ncbi:hypothetical protein D3C71_1035390 [compost metagenome]
MTGDEIKTYWSEARAAIEGKLIPLAQKTNCIPRGATLDSLRRRTPRFERDDPKREAALSVQLLSELCAKGDSLVTLREELTQVLQGEAAALALLDETLAGAHEEIAPICERLMGQLAGYLAALHATNSFRVKRGAQSRRAQGDVTRDRVKLVAKQYTHLSRESAAFQIADVVGKSSGTIRRLLSELFPGEEWHKSIDPSQHTG